MTVSYNSLWHRDGRICHILRREYVQTEEDMNEKCIMQGEAWYLKWKRVEKWCWFVKKKLFREKECMCWDEGGRDRRREYLNKNAWRGLAAIGVAVVLTMGECVSGIQLGMETAKFEDCCGLTASTTHAMSARDIALMSRELITKYPEIFQYSTIWMENITHRTKQGEKEFGLSNTNKLLKMVTNFEVTGLKTGSTSLAKYCLSATGRKDGVDLIAVILAAPDYKARFADAVTLLNYGFANCHLYKDENPGAVPETTVAGGIQEQVAGRLRGTFSYLSMGGENLDGIEKEWMMEESCKAPVREGDVIGHLVYQLDGRELGSVEIEAAETVEKAGLWDYFKKVMGVFAA